MWHGVCLLAFVAAPCEALGSPSGWSCVAVVRRWCMVLWENAQPAVSGRRRRPGGRTGVWGGEQDGKTCGSSASAKRTRRPRRPGKSCCL